MYISSLYMHKILPYLFGDFIIRHGASLLFPEVVFAPPRLTSFVFLQFRILRRLKSIQSLRLIQRINRDKRS